MTTDSGPAGWMVIGGTSAAAPAWAGLFAIANQGRAVRGLNSLQSGPAALYRLPPADFHDVIGGSNGLYCGPGYDLVTGIGTPYADRVVAGLIASNDAAGTTPATRLAVSAPSHALQSRLTAKCLATWPEAPPWTTLGEGLSTVLFDTSNGNRHHPGDPDDPNGPVYAS